MDTFIFSTIIGYAAIALLFTVAGLLIYAFWRTRNPGFLWLIATYLWPYIAEVIERPIARSVLSGKLATGSLGHFMQWSGTSIGQFLYFFRDFNVIVQASLMIVAVLCLIRRRQGQKLALAI